jgi:hypothetical protein
VSSREKSVIRLIDWQSLCITATIDLPAVEGRCQVAVE